MTTAKEQLAKKKTHGKMPHKPEPKMPHQKKKDAKK